jgi:hypothetical protein
MSSINLTAQQINSTVPTKLKLQDLRQKRERRGDFYLDGKYQFTVTMPNIHGGVNSLSPLFLRVCRNSVYLNSSQYADLVKCPMSADDYEKFIREYIESKKK